MANDPSAQPPAKAAGAAPAQTADAAPDPTLKMSPSAWGERARTTFDVSPHALAGALFGVEPDAQLTEDEVRSKLDAFSVREGL